MSKLKNEIGNTYGRLTVIERAENHSRGGAQWLCECECGSLHIVLGSRLRNGTTKSCGCLKRDLNLKNEIGNTYGKLTVIEEAEGKNGYAFWKCECECGSVVDVRGDRLRNGNTQSCGCIKSVGESVVAKILTENNIEFKREYKFDNLRGISKRLRFDFAIFKDEELTHLIEFDGKQHYDKNSRFYNEETATNDKLKNEYCTLHNIPLIRLRDYKDLTIEDLLLK